MNQQVPTIVFEDENMLAVSKPAGMIVNNADTAKDVLTLQDFIFEKYPEIFNSKNRTKYMVDGYDKTEEFFSRGAVVHRLDKETSGIVLIAKNVETFINLQKQFKSKEVQKEYVALVHGKVQQKTGEIKAPIGRLPWNRMRFGVLKEGRDAWSSYSVLSYKAYTTKKDTEMLSYVAVFPKTGRTHQIRVHFQHIGNPIFADALYAGRKTARDDRQILSRHFLHAIRISFISPTTNSRITVEAGLPSDLDAFLASLKDA